eukprot:c27281_g1_i2 orf=101-2215(+)
MARSGFIPDDTVLYTLYPDSAFGDSPPQIDEHLAHLRHECLEAVVPFMDGYIWQHQAFDLVVPSDESSCLCNSEPRSNGDCLEWEDSTQPPSRSSSVYHLHGKVKFGDNIEDEWFVVFLLFEISRRVKSVSIRTWDMDGEFILIEAAYHIPRWLKPENSWNRVFIRQGWLHILPMPSSPAEIYQLPVKPSIRDALKVFALGTVKTRASEPAQSAIQRRLDGYPEKAKKNMHNTRCRVPLPIAQILKHEPQLVSLAVEAFYDRDMDSMKAASCMEKFLQKGSDGQVEMVDVVVRMSRVMYAQLVQQVFQAPRCYPMLSFSDPHFKEAELGMKLTCGFEMMYWERSRHELSSESSIQAEAGRFKEDMAKKDVGWQAFQSSLEQRGYFRNLLKGSREYCQVLEAAMTRYKETHLFAEVSAAMHAPVKCITEILMLPHSVHDFVGYKFQCSDDDSWLFNREDLTNALLERQREMDAYESGQIMDKEAKPPAASVQTTGTDGDFNFEDVVRNMHAFINKVSSFEGAEVPIKENSLSINTGIFLKELSSVVGLKEQLQTENLLEDMESSSSDTDFADEDMEDNIYEDGDHSMAFDGGGENTKKNVKNVDPLFMKEYSEALSQELHNSSMAKSFVPAGESSTSIDMAEGVEQDKDVPLVNIDANLIQSLLESYSTQQGLPGPASNLLGAMGLHLSDDSRESKDHGVSNHTI